MTYDDQPVRAVRRLYRCPKCGDGHIESTGCALLCNPMKYEHRCLQCGEVFTLASPTAACTISTTRPSHDRHQSPRQMHHGVPWQPALARVAHAAKVRKFCAFALDTNPEAIGYRHA